MADALELHEGEKVEKEFKGDYWAKTLFTYSQKRGQYWLTTERIIFRGGFAAALDLPYSEIASVRTCNVGPLIQFLPTGLLVSTKDGKAYRLSVLKRKEVLAFIESKIK